MREAGMIDGRKAPGELAGVPKMLALGEMESARVLVQRLKGIIDHPMLRACEIMLECASGRTDRAEVLLGQSGDLLRSAPMRDVNHFFLQLFTFHLDRGEIGCARRILDAGAGYGLGWRDFGMPYILYCDRASLAEEGLLALTTYFPDIRSGLPDVLSALRQRYPFLTGLPGLKEAVPG
jgi:hypothetical protein